MAGIIVNELVTKFSASIDRSFAVYEATLKRLDKEGERVTDSLAKRFSDIGKRITDSFSGRSLGNFGESVKRNIDAIGNHWQSAGSKIQQTNNSIVSDTIAGYAAIRAAARASEKEKVDAARDSAAKIIEAAKQSASQQIAAAKSAQYADKNARDKAVEQAKISAQAILSAAKKEAEGELAVAKEKILAARDVAREKAMLVRQTLAAEKAAARESLLAAKAAEKESILMFKGQESRMRNLMGLALGLGGGFLGVAGAQRFGEELFTTVGTKQQNMGRLETQLGSKEAAKAKYEQYRKFAEITPFEKNELLSSAGAIRGSGYELTDADLKGLGNVVSSSRRGDGSARSFSEMTEMLKSANRGLGNMVDNFDGMKARAHDGVLTMERFDMRLKKWITEDIEAGDMKGFVRFVRQHGEANYGGEMERQSKTLPGLLSTVKDRLTSRFEDIGDFGGERVLNNIMNRLVNFTGEIEPQAKRIGKAIGAAFDALPGIMTKIKNIAPYVEKGLYIIGTHLVGLKAIAMGKGVLALVTGFSALPLIIGGAIVAVGAFGYQVYKYITQGNTALTQLREQFPFLADLIVGTGEGVKYVTGVFQAWWPAIQKVGEVISIQIVAQWEEFRANWNAGYAAMLQNYENWKQWISGIGEGFNTWGLKIKITFDAAKEFFGWIGEIAGSIKIKLEDTFAPFKWLFEKLETAKNYWGNIGGGSGEEFNVRSSGVTGNIASTAVNFVRSGQADKFAFSGYENNGFITKELFKQGVACAQTTEYIVAQAGASKKVLDAMNASAPGTFNALKGRGLAQEVSEKSAQAGDLIFYIGKGGMQHIGVYVGDGKVVDAENAAGKQIGTGQRVVLADNWMKGNARYLRINDKEMAGSQLTQPAQKSVLVPGRTGNAGHTITVPIQIVTTNSRASAQDIARTVKEQASAGIQSGLSKAANKSAQAVARR